MWARFYELGTGRPFFCDRDGVVKYQLSEIGYERRNGYAWYSTIPNKALQAYDAWAAHHPAQPAADEALGAPAH